MTPPPPLWWLLHQLGIRPEPKGIPARITICADIPEICVKSARDADTSGRMDPDGSPLMIGDHGCVAPRQVDAVAEGLERIA